MFKSHLKLALRNILNSGVYSILNAAGLSIGFLTFIIIAHHFIYEKTYDDFDNQSNSVYRVNLKTINNEIGATSTALNYPNTGPELKNTFNEITNFCRLFSMQHSFTRAISIEKESGIINTFNEDHIYYADPSFFTFFPFKLKFGNKDAISKPYQAFISEEISIKYFGGINPVGKTIIFNHSKGKEQYKVAGIIKVPANTHLDIHVLLSYSSLTNGPLKTRAFNNWENEQAYTYVHLTKGTNPQIFNRKLDKFIKRHLGPERNIKFELQRISDIHISPQLLDEFKPTVSVLNLNFLALGGSLLLLLVSLNFINISTIYSTRRNTELLIRQLSGGTQWQIFIRFSIEFSVLSFLALLTALILFFGIWDISFVNLPIIPSIIALLILLIIAFISGIIPAYSILKKDLNGGTYHFTSKHGIVISFQFLIGICMLIATITISNQLYFMKNKELGMDIKNTLILKGPSIFDFSKTQTSIRNKSFSEELLKDPNISQVSYSGFIPGIENGWIVNAQKNPEDKNSYEISFNIVNENFLEVFKINLIAGRNFLVYDQRTGSFGEKVESTILNMSAAKALGFQDMEDAIGNQILVANKACEIIGIIEDFHQQSLQYPIRPSAYFLDRNTSLYFSIKFNGIIESDDINSYKSHLEHLKSIFNHYYPGNPFECFSLEDFFNQQYKKEQQFFQSFLSLSAVAIMISCLGLLGMSILYSSRRSKEIGIRKVNGAKVSEILMLLNKDFVKWVVIAFVIATPIAWYAMNQWLENFAYKTELSWWVFALAGLLALAIAVLTVSWQSWRAATRNPVDALRYE